MISQVQDVSEITEDKAHLSNSSDHNDDHNTLEYTKELNMYSACSSENIKWLKVIPFVLVNLIAVYGFITFPYIERYKTAIWAGLFVSIYSIFGVTGGAHRYWTHRSFKAKLPLQAILAFCYTSTYMVTIFEWVTFHRVHHKYTDTDADPHNSSRGFLFCHVGWFLTKYHPEVKKRVKEVDISDLKADSFVCFIEKNFYVFILITHVISIGVPVYFWNELWYYTILMQFMRHIYVVHMVMSINSFAHMYGYRPYNKNIKPSENTFVGLFVLGEGWHNYHHTFPYDYRMSEIGPIKFDLTAALIRLFSKIGWAYDLKTPSDSFIQRTIEQKGDKTVLKSIF